MTYTIWGIDPSTSATGLACLTIDQETKRIVKIETVLLNALKLHRFQPIVGDNVEKNPYYRADLMLSYIRRLLEETAPLYIYSEVPHIDSNKANNVEPLLYLKVKLGELIKEHVFVRHLRLHATSCKSIVGANQRKGIYKSMTTKEKVLYGLKNTSEISSLIDLDLISEDEVDAILIAYAGHNLPSTNFV